MIRKAYFPKISSPKRIHLFDGEPDVMTASKAAELLGVVTETVYREIARGNLEAIHVGRNVRITKAALLRYVEEA